MTMTKEEAQQAYDGLIAYRRQNVLVKSKDHPGMIEKHHIIPTSINGLDIDENKIALLAKEHFMAHVYLWIIHHDDEFHDQMLCALMNMHKGTKNGNRKELRDFILMSEDYQQAREEFGKIASKIASEANKGEKNPHFGQHWYKDPNSNNYSLYKDGEQPNGWIRGKYLTKNEKYSLRKEKGKYSYIFNVHTKINKTILKEEAQKLVSTGEWQYGRIQKPMSEQGKQNIREAQLRRSYEYHAPKNKNKHRYVNLETKKYIYLSGDDIIPSGYVKSSSLREHKDSKVTKHFKWLKETQDMADYFSEYGYEETCKQFNVNMSIESMIMRFIRARKLYGIHFESQPGKKRKFKSINPQ